MEHLAGLFSSLDKKIPVSWILLVFMVIVYVKMHGMAQDISHIQKDLGNHITATNRKIDRLSDRIDKQNARFEKQFDKQNVRFEKQFDKQNARFEKQFNAQHERFDRLYEALLRGKGRKKQL